MQMKNQGLIGLIAGVASICIIFMSVSGSENSFALSQLTINGAGSTFVFPLMDTWRIAYQKVQPNVNINYQSIGSGGGVKQFTAKTVDFGASDAPLNAEERQAALGAVQIPETIGSVAVAYNVPGIPTNTLKLTGPVLADIFQGKITKWNDPQIKALNPGVNLPNSNIVVVHRSDGSGITLCPTACRSREAQSRYPKINNFQRHSSIQRTIELSNLVPTTNVVVNEYFFSLFSDSIIRALACSQRCFVRVWIQSCCY